MQSERPAGQPESGHVALVGAGPGDPALLTLRAKQLLAKADLVLYDALVHPEVLAHASPSAERLFVGKRAGKHDMQQVSINAQLVRAGLGGRRVVRLKGGDPYLFGRGSEEAELLARADINFEVVPGVPSPLAATAYAGISLTHRALSSSVAYITATESPDKTQSSHDWPKLATATETLVIFMGLRRLASLVATLREHGRPPETPVAVIQNASLPAQRTVCAPLHRIAQAVADAGLGTPALVVVGEVVTLREQLRWFDTRPLHGHRVLVTRSLTQAAALRDGLRELGAEAICQPTIAFSTLTPPAPLSPQLKAHDWLIFTSANAVDAFFRQLRTEHRDARALASIQIAVIGGQTARCLERYGVTADLLPICAEGGALAEALLAESSTAQRYLLPGAETMRPVLREALEAAGHAVTHLPLYRTHLPDESEQEALRALVKAGRLSWVTFTSGSTAEHYAEIVGETLRSSVAAITIGAITTATCQRLGIRVAAEADTASAAGMLQAFRKLAAC